MRYNLFLDDFRKPSDPGDYMNPRYRGMYKNSEWEVVRNYDQFVHTIELMGIPDKISFDHDLADEHYAPTGISYDEFKEKTGYHCMQWLIERLIEEDVDELPFVIVHSMNPVGAENIERLWENFKRHRNEIRKD